MSQSWLQGFTNTIEIIFDIVFFASKSLLGIQEQNVSRTLLYLESLETMSEFWTVEGGRFEAAHVIRLHAWAQFSRGNSLIY